MQLGSEGLDRGSVGSFLAETLMVLSLSLSLNTGAGLGGLGVGGELRNQTWFLTDGVWLSLWSTQVPQPQNPQKAYTSLSLQTELPVGRDLPEPTGLPSPSQAPPRWPLPPFTWLLILHNTPARPAEWVSFSLLGLRN